MSNEKIITGVLVDETTTYTYLEVCRKYHIPEELLIEIVEQGLFPHTPSVNDAIDLDQKALQRLEIAFRLHQDLEVNPPGVVLALELLEEMSRLRDELDILRKHF